MNKKTRGGFKVVENSVELCKSFNPKGIDKNKPKVYNRGIIKL